MFLIDDVVFQLMGKQWASNKTSSGEFTLVMHLVIDFQLIQGLNARLTEHQSDSQSQIMGPPVKKLDMDVCPLLGSL